MSIVLNTSTPLAHKCAQALRLMLEPIQMRGSSIKVFIDEVERMSATDSTIRQQAGLASTLALIA
jgi:hypothetical protein